MILSKIDIEIQHIKVKSVAILPVRTGNALFILGLGEYFSYMKISDDLPDGIKIIPH